MRRRAIGLAYLRACLLELEALKPGNVHLYAGGHGMTARHFTYAALASAPFMAAPSCGVGSRIRRAVTASLKAAGCNANLGIVLLAAPLAEAACRMPRGAPDCALPPTLREVLSSLDNADAADAFAAIRDANPGGLGQAPRHDVRNAPGVTLKDAMAEAAQRDLIARQYAHGYVDIRRIALPCLVARSLAGDSPANAATVCYLTLLAARPDSHVARKHGQKRARALSRQAADFMKKHEPVNVDKVWTRLLAWDARLKEEGVNAGAIADLTVAALFAFHLKLTVS